MPADPALAWIAPPDGAAAVPRHAAGALEGAAGAAARAREARRAEDARLAIAARGGDPDAFRQLVERHQRAVYWVAYDILLDAEEARDVAQETFLRVHAALHAFDPSRDFLNWLYRIARNLAIDAFRRRRRRAVPVGDPAAAEAPVGVGPGSASPARRGESHELQQRVQDVLATLPVEYRLALTLREFHGLSPREIATLTDCTYPTARWRLHRARALFKQAWEQRYGDASRKETP